MKAVATFLAVLAFAVSMVNSAFAAKPQEPPDKTLSPYFFVRSDDASTDRLPLKSTSAEVNIAGVIADVKVTQVYRNDGTRPIEAIYVFPASTRAAVHGMKMTIGERVVEARIKKRDEARKEYEQAKQQGKNASLLEQHRPNVFQMNVANIMPGDVVKVELRYTELLVSEDKVYEFVYPTVVGPRYSNQQAETASAQDRWVGNPYLREGEAPTYSFDLTATISAGMPVKDVACTSHKANVTYNGPSSAAVRLDGSEKNGGNRDYVLKYRLDGDKVESGLLLYKGESENFFLLMMQPPKRTKLSEIPGREYIFIVDVSGSMYGFPLEISKKLLKDLIGKLRPTDTFNVLLFAGSNSVMSERSLAATPENIAKAAALIDNQRGGGGTELLPALKRALALPRTEGNSRTVVIATDGYVHVETEAFDLIRRNLGNANMFTFGIGSSVNRHLLEGMARVGMGEPFVVAKPDEAPAQAERFRKMIEAPLLTKVRIDFGKFDAYDIEPLSVPDVMAERPVIVFGKWRGKAEGTITVRGLTGEGKYERKIDPGVSRSSTGNAALQYLWARHRIATLADYNLLQADDKRIREVTDLGLKYNLLTAYTSFVAVDTVVRNSTGEQTTVTQPLPLPQGVSNYAVGEAAAYSPAPLAQGVYRSEAARKMVDSSLASKEEKKKDAGKPVTIDSIEVSDRSVQAAVEKTVKSRVAELQGCNPGGPSGSMGVTLKIDPAGKVKDVAVVSASAGTKELEKCIIAALKKWKFSGLKKGSEVVVKITIRF